MDRGGVGRRDRGGSGGGSSDDGGGNDGGLHGGGVRVSAVVMTVMYLC